jgi:hypothetical protein
MPSAAPALLCIVRPARDAGQLAAFQGVVSETILVYRDPYYALPGARHGVDPVLWVVPDGVVAYLDALRVQKQYAGPGRPVAGPDVAVVRHDVVLDHARTPAGLVLDARLAVGVEGVAVTTMGPPSLSHQSPFQ